MARGAVTLRSDATRAITARQTAARARTIRLVRRRAVVVLAILAVALIVAWRSCDRSDHSVPPPATVSKPAVARIREPAARGAITGTVIDEAKAPIGGAFVCVHDDCVRSNAVGAFRIDVAAGRHVVRASAKPYEPGHGIVTLAPSELKPIEVVLHSGGVELSGVVSDASGGPIANARVTSYDASTDTAADGTFSLWVAPRSTGISARADGYAPVTRQEVVAPAYVELALTPEGVITGTVIDARTQPVVGARVSAAGDFQRATGCHHRRAGHVPSRRARWRTLRADRRGTARLRARRIRGRRGRWADSGVVLALHPAATVVGHAVIAPARTPCNDADVTIEDARRDRQRTLEQRGNAWIAEGVLAGTYRVTVSCWDALARRDYPPLVVGADDVEATWGGRSRRRIEGRVTNRAGARIAGVSVSTYGSRSSGSRRRCPPIATASRRWTVSGRARTSSRSLVAVSSCRQRSWSRPARRFVETSSWTIPGRSAPPFVTRRAAPARRCVMRSKSTTSLVTTAARPTHAASFTSTVSSPATTSCARCRSGTRVTARTVCASPCHANQVASTTLVLAERGRESPGRSSTVQAVPSPMPSFVS